MSSRRGSTVSSGAIAWQRLKKSVSETEPKDMVKFIIIGICILLVYLQVTACFSKLNNPEITTHTELKQNETMTYPALTICRVPAFNRRYYAKYNMTNIHLGSTPTTSQWSNFPFSKYSIGDFFNDAMYTAKVFLAYGLGMDNRTKLSSSVHLTLGQCHTLIPSNDPNFTKPVGKKYGYSVTLSHDLYEYKPLLDETPGWYIYIHEPRETFSENTELLAGRQDHLFVRVGEQVEVNLETIEFRTLKNCNNSQTYSETQCEERCWVENIFTSVNCTGPWFSWVEKPYCDNAVGFLKLLRATLGMNYLNCCLPHCETKQYTTSVVSRITSDAQQLTSSVYVYFTSKAVLTMKESYAYDWNLFVADLGGTLGFLLGLSVIGIVGVFEEVFKLIWGRRKKNEQENKLKIPNQQQQLSPYPVDYKWKLDTPFKISPTVVAKIDQY